MMPKNRHGFSADIMLDRFGLDHGHVFGSVQSKDIVIEACRRPESAAFAVTAILRFEHLDLFDGFEAHESRVDGMQPPALRTIAAPNFLA